jgi:hypothetical protein
MKYISYDWVKMNVNGSKKLNIIANGHKIYMRCDNINVQSNEHIHQLVVVEEDDNIHLNTL